MVGYSFLIGDPFAGSAVFADNKVPSNPRMTLTVPEMRRVDHVPVYTGAASDEGALHDGTLHVRGTGWPWREGANIYIAGHRMGFPGTKSYLVFWDLNALKDGDRVTLTDADGTTYISVSRASSSTPTPLRHEARTRKSIITLQTCTLPDYNRSHRPGGAN